MTSQSTFFSFPRLDRPGTGGISSEEGNRGGDVLELSALLAEESVTNRTTNQSTSACSVSERQYWLSDELCKECYSCEKPFYMLRRKHHCRVCGRIFCSSCSAYSVTGKPYGYAQSTVRACKDCFEIAKEQPHDLPPPQPPLPLRRSPSQTLPTRQRSPEAKPREPRSPSRSQASAVPTETRTPTRHSIAVKDSEKLMYRRPISRLRMRLAKRSKSMNSLKSAGELSGDGIEPEKYAAFCQRLLRKLCQRKIKEWLDASDQGSPTVVLSQARADQWASVLTSLASDACKRVRPRLSLLPSAEQSAGNSAEMTGAAGGNGGKDGDSLKRDSTDISKYIKVCCIPGGTVDSATKLNGLVFEKQLIHRKMKVHVPFPRIMALESSLEFAREESRMLSLETLYEQELQYMKLIVDKIASVGVDVLLVGKAVSRIGQELLLEAGISVAIHMPASVLRRIARLTGARVLPSVDHIIPSTNPTGTCKLWRVEKLDVTPTSDQLEEISEDVQDKKQRAKRVMKSYMFFEGCSASMGATIVLRGGASLTLDMLRGILENVVKKAYLLTLQQKLFADLSARAVPTDETELLEMLDKDSIPLWQVRTRGVLQATFPEKVRYRFWEDSMDQPLGLFLLKRGAGLKRQPETAQRAANARPDGTHYPDKEGEKGSSGAGTVSGGEGTSRGDTTVASQESVNLDETMDYFSIFYIHGERRLKVIFENLNVTKDPGLVAIREQLLTLRRKIVATRVTDSSMNRRGAIGSGSAQISANFLLCWSACKACGRRTKVKALSRDAAYISYGKFIQMKLYDRYTRVQLPGCTHLLFEDCITYFEYFGVVGSFEFEPNKVYSFTLGGGTSSLRFHERWLNSYVPFRALKLEIALAHISKTFARRLNKFSSHLIRSSSEEGSSQVMGAMNASIIQRCESLASAINDEVRALKQPLANAELSLAAVCLLQKRLLLSIADWNNRFEDMQDRICVPKPTPAFANLVQLPPQWTKMAEESDTTGSSKTETTENGQSDTEAKETKLRRHESEGSTKHLMPQVEVSAAFNEGHPLMLNNEDPCPCLVFTNEPTSMIAHCLGSMAYKSLLARKVVSLGVKSEKLVDLLTADGSKGQDEVKLTFRDESPHVTFEVKVFHALKFEALRNPEGSLDAIPAGDTVRFILSLSRCSAWGASGGKTKAKFFRSKDNTLLAKTISIEELELFHASANKYFAHMHDAYTGNKPSAIMKILGIYTLSVTNGFSPEHTVEEHINVSTGDTLGESKEGVQDLRKPNKMHLLVMKKLFVDSSVELNKFDLKGNFRNRYVHSPKPGDVLLDVNFFETYNGVPITVEKEDKELLKRATSFDTKLFEQSGIVDYSLILGIPKDGEESNEVVLGIVDYLQLYNYRKMIESNVKKAAMIAGQLEPTVIGPARYQLRFTKALNRYFIAKLEDD